jgi:nucleotide-binding universal stress UspA family protein
MLPSRILVATDGSPAANAAVTFAAEMAKTMKATELVVVSVTRTHMVGSKGVPVAVLNVDPKEIAAREELVKEAADSMRMIVGGDAVRIETKVLQSLSPADAIISEAHVTGTCSHIVIGDRGHGGFEGLRLGGVSHHVIQGADCPVTVIRV